MEDVRVFSRILFLFSMIYIVKPMTNYDALLQEIPTSVFQRYIKVSRHQPFCVVFRNSSVGSKLEKVTYDIWQNTHEQHNFTSWQLAAFCPNKARMPPNNARPVRLPSVRCYLGESSTYQYGGKVNKADLMNWLAKLSTRYSEQSAEVTPSRIEENQRQYQILLLAFPDGPRHHEVEDMIYGMAEGMESCKAMAVHLNCAHVTSLRQRFDVKKYPSVVVVHNTVTNGTVKEDFQVFSGHNVKPHVMNVYITAHSVVAPMLTLQTFEQLLHGNERDPSWEFQPSLICFYAYWAQDVHGYLYAYNSTIIQYRRDHVRLKYGLVNLSKDSSKLLISRHLRSGAMIEVPFLGLFYRDAAGSLKTSYLHIGRPYTWTMYKPIENLGQGLLDLTGIRQYSEPWGTVSFDQYSSMQEGPHGQMCTAWAHNMTDNSPVVRKHAMKKKRVVSKPIVMKPVEHVNKSLHDLFDTDVVEKKLDVHENIALLTLETWTNVVEKSHAPRHIFYKSGKWAGEVTKVSLVIFIMANCGSCRRNNQTFRDIQQAVSHIDGGSLYYVNCTAERILCRNHNIHGFPTLAAYRGLGWMHTTACLTSSSQKMFKKYVRIDYHGVIMAEPVLEWFSRISDNSVINVNSKDHLPKTFQDKDVWLIASVVPANNTESFWSYACLRLLCERLYSILDCFSTHTGNLPENIDVVVTKLRLERRDGVKATVMEHRVPLLDTMEDPRNDVLHKFHKPHSYKINASQTCEEDLTVCTDVVTEFILDHSRLPVTPLTSDMFHTSTSLLKDDELPILVAIGYRENLTDSSPFMRDLTSVAYNLYNDITVMTLDASKYTKWATKIVPVLYSHIRTFHSEDLDPLMLYTYPRLVIVKKDDHNHAALYPQSSRKRKKDEEFSREAIMAFVQSYLQEPESWIIQTEHF